MTSETSAPSHGSPEPCGVESGPGADQPPRSPERCPWCAGSGLVEWIDVCDALIRCPKCEGTGLGILEREALRNERLSNGGPT